MNTSPYLNNNALTLPEDGHFQVMVSFPLQVLATYLWPVPTTFARHKQQARWSILTIWLSGLLLITGVGAYIWGRLPTLNRGIENLSLHHLNPQILTPASVIALALTPPLLILGWTLALHLLARTQEGRGSYHVQLYSMQIIATPPVLLLITTTLLLSVAPNMATPLRLPLAAIAILLSLYSFLLCLPSLMGVQQLSRKQAIICLVIILTVALLLIFFMDTFSSNHTSGGGGERSTKKPKNWHARYCSYCGFSLQVYDRLHDTHTQICPRCGQTLS
ncbi:hypothetical protein KDA_70900 [Dictyobacter alpinus]|uniref:Yip1 domain-containing protein n=1 Tax=Dictyobacter alpinus TaxID=2014873 RepID=A0A402BJV3_9CHLR|nr:Yip1 family protein [Dictyobacter alpinus]GCE31606.1 hypothetical protein KDA_70900 [Dictyobacter alpinus]